MKDPRVALTTALFGLGALGALAAAGCNAQQTPGCASTQECPSGHVCEARDCLQLCDFSEDCPPGETCDGSVCRVGAVGKPTIETVTGNSAQDCPPLSGVPCLGSAIVVTGTNLPGSTFRLESTDASPDIALKEVASTGFSVNLVPDPVSSIRTGDYRLVVTNSAGSADQLVTLLQGERGPEGPQGPAGPAGPQGPAGVCEEGCGGTGGTGGGGPSSVLYINVDGIEGQQPIASDRYVVILTKEPGAVTTLPLDVARVVELCGDLDGCQVELGATDVDDGVGIIRAPYMGPTCRLHLFDNGGGYEWAISPHCYQGYRVMSPSGEVDYYPYTSNGAGTDGDNAERGTVLNFLRACLLSEAPPDLGIAEPQTFPTYGPDTAVGFHLIATDTTWWANALPTSCEPDEVCWSGDAPTCMLLIQD